jgi:GntR family transcriptional regulator
MNLVIAAKSETPIYEQIHDQIAAQIIAGDLAPDVCLPSIRVVAAELGVSIITIKKAWEMLEAERFLYTRAGKGCFVAGPSATGHADRRIELAEARLPSELAYYASLGLSREEYLRLAGKLYPED